MTGLQQVTLADGLWEYHQIPAGRSTKAYLCPGCQGQIPPAEPHVVGWPALAPIGSRDATEFRRHWHTACWARRR